MKANINPNTLLMQIISMEKAVITHQTRCMIEEIERLENEAAELADSPALENVKRGVKREIIRLRGLYEQSN